MAKRELEYEFVQKDTKHRQGLYIKIRWKRITGKPNRWNEYKYHEGDTLDTYLEYHKQKDKPKRTTLGQMRKVQRKEYQDKRPKQLQTAWQTYQKYLKKLQKRGTINQHVQAGVTQAKPFDPNNMTNAKLLKVYEQLLGPLVRDKELLSFVIKNARKFSHNFRYDTRIDGKTTQGVHKRLAKITDIGRRHLEQYMVDYIQSGLCVRQAKIDSDWKLKAQRVTGVPGELIERYTTGKIGQVQTTVTYLRGKGRK